MNGRCWIYSAMRCFAPASMNGTYSRTMPVATGGIALRPCVGTGLSSTWRLSCGLEARPTGPFVAPFVGNRERAPGAGDRLPVSDRTDGYHHTAGRVPFPRLWHPGAVRAFPHTRCKFAPLTIPAGMSSWGPWPAHLAAERFEDTLRDLLRARREISQPADDLEYDQSEAAE